MSQATFFILEKRGTPIIYIVEDDDNIREELKLLLNTSKSTDKKSDTILECGNVRLDTSVALSYKDNKKAELTKNEMKILYYLFVNKGNSIYDKIYREIIHTSNKSVIEEISCILFREKYRTHRR